MNPAVTVVTTLVCFILFRTRGRGCGGTRHSPRPLLGEEFKHTSGASRRGGAKLCRKLFCLNTSARRCYFDIHQVRHKTADRIGMEEIVLLAVFADIHANRQAFSACLDFARARGAERIICLGDFTLRNCFYLWNGRQYLLSRNCGGRTQAHQYKSTLFGRFCDGHLRAWI